MSTTRVKYELDKVLEPHGITVGNNDRVKYVEAAYDTAMRAADTQKEGAIKAAGDTLAGSLAGAEANYKRARVNYGVTAERMAQAGLTGSGYSDNLARDAYAMRQASMDNARVAYGDAVERANYTYGDAKTKAETDAIGALAGAFENNQQDFAKYLGAVKTGEITPVEAERLAAGLGLGEDQLKMIKDAGLAYGRDTVVTDVNSPEFSASAIEAAVDQGYLKREDADDIKAKWLADVMNDESAFMVDGALMAAEDAERMVKDYENHAWADPATAEAFRKAFENTYGNVSGLVTPSVKFKVDNWTTGLEKEGNDFIISLQNKDGTNKTFKVESGGEVVNEKIISAAKDLENGAVFGYDGKAYIYKNGRVYAVRGTGGGALSTDAYDAIFKGKDFSYSYAPEKTSTAQKTTPNEATRRRQKGITNTVSTSYPKKHKR